MIILHLCCIFILLPGGSMNHNSQTQMTYDSYVFRHYYRSAYSPKLTLSVSAHLLFQSYILKKTDINSLLSKSNRKVEKSNESSFSVLRLTRRRSTSAIFRSEDQIKRILCVYPHTLTLSKGKKAGATFSPMSLLKQVGILLFFVFFTACAI